jgi:energy-converting hydrogenase Eha subunit H
MIAVFIAQALSVIGAGSLVGIDVFSSALLAGLLGVANVLEILARKYLNDGQLTYEEVNQAFGILDSKTHNDMNGRGLDHNE